MPKEGNRNSRNPGWLEVAARLKRGVTRDEAAAELTVFGQRLSQTYPDSEKDRGFGFESAGALPPRYKTSVRMFLAALTVVVLLVLGIACANVANLLLAQAAGRQREIDFQAGTRRKTRRRLTPPDADRKCPALPLTGGILGVALSLWATRALSTFRLPAPVPMNLKVGVDSTVLLYPSWSVWERDCCSGWLRRGPLHVRFSPIHRCGAGVSAACWWSPKSPCR